MFVLVGDELMASQAQTDGIRDEIRHPTFSLYQVGKLHVIKALLL
jgi:hypothetical protein